MTAWTTRLGGLVAMMALAMAPAARASSAARCAAPGATVRERQCGPADGRGCLVVRETPAALAGRVLQDAVSLAAHVTSAITLEPLATGRQAHWTPPVRPPGPTAASLPLRI